VQDKKPPLKIIIFLNYKHWFIILAWSDKAFRYFPKGFFWSGNFPNVQFPKHQLRKSVVAAVLDPPLFACRFTWKSANSPFNRNIKVSILIILFKGWNVQIIQSDFLPYWKKCIIKKNVQNKKTFLNYSTIFTIPGYPFKFTIWRKVKK